MSSTKSRSAQFKLRCGECADDTFKMWARCKDDSRTDELGSVTVQCLACGAISDLALVSHLQVVPHDDGVPCGPWDEGIVEGDPEAAGPVSRTKEVKDADAG